MSIIEKINFLLLEKGISKKEFSDSLRKLEPKLFATGDTPSEQTIYRYLNGSRKSCLSPFICVKRGKGRGYSYRIRQ